MRLPVAVFYLCAGAFLLPRSGSADERSDQARRAEEARRANKESHPNDETRRAEEARRAEQARRLDQAPPNAPADPAVHRPGEWRLSDLEAKERAGGKFSAEEKLAYERLKAERQQRYKDLAESDQKKEQDRLARRSEAKRQLLARYQAAATNPDVRQEFQRDAEIMAHLQRARDVAQADGRDDAVARVDKLVQKETARHAAWLAAHGQG